MILGVWESVLGPHDLLALLLQRSPKVLVDFGLPGGIPSVPDRDKLSTREEYCELMQRSFDWYGGELSILAWHATVHV